VHYMPRKVQMERTQSGLCERTEPKNAGFWAR
jgi:hypothetical protein